MTDPIDVRGGAGGLAAELDELRVTAGQLGAAAHELGAMAFTLHAYLLDPGIRLAGVIDDHDLRTFTSSLADALDGSRGLTRGAADLGFLDVEVRAAAAAYAAVDRLGTRLGDLLTGATNLPLALVASARALLASGNPLAAAEAVSSTTRSSPTSCSACSECRQPSRRCPRPFRTATPSSRTSGSTERRRRPASRGRCVM
jgi:hypothetical protein